MRAETEDDPIPKNALTILEHAEFIIALTNYSPVRI